MIKGCVSALVTPMKHGGQIDFNSLDRLVDYHLAEESDGLLLMGSTGEPALLTYDEKKEIVTRVVGRVDGKIPIWGGVGTSSTRESIIKIKDMERWGINACLCVVPYYVKPTPQGIFEHFASLADAVSVPIFIYNVPGRVGTDISLQTLIKLSELPNIVGMKEGTSNVERAIDWMQHLPENFLFYAGDDAVSLPSLLMGAYGCVSVTGNVVPRLMHDMCRYAFSGQLNEAREINSLMWGLHRFLFSESSPIPVKWVLSEMGLIEPGIRLPLTWLRTEHHDNLRSAMKQAGIFKRQSF
ncbi:Dihydrodipicolinate synthase [Candidatus Ichthyocystis hellenicum]|uniref:4-hydroxy-tetrahydrodipicolinate synthase n=1 Tax=Candidatus Ichthyocystis hellenicum TaxID=1561003 RepID=A0A0S4M452_9BURK|nr:4-hydroxy-tetrahydrodipicolinate synthase [Candidatus Ichthyocystis hellenicum]CUT18000.1 Dihydrodipicolinate synthase [Candidatus Ichthyocystis hellenicum]